MVVATGEHEAFNPPRPASQGLADQRRGSPLECAVAFAQPPSVQRVETRPLKGLRGAIKTFIRTRSDPRARCRPQLFEVRLQLLDRTWVQRAVPFLSHSRLVRPVAVRELSRKDESQRPGLYARQELAVAVEEPTKVAATGSQKNV